MPLPRAALSTLAQITHSDAPTPETGIRVGGVADGRRQTAAAEVYDFGCRFAVPPQPQPPHPTLWSRCSGSGHSPFLTSHEVASIKCIKAMFGFGDRKVWHDDPGSVRQDKSCWGVSGYSDSACCESTATTSLDACSRTWVMSQLCSVHRSAVASRYDL